MPAEWLSTDRERCNLLRGVLFCNFRFVARGERKFPFYCSR